MRIPTLRRGRRSEDESGVVGAARLDHRTKNLTKRLSPGDIAIIDHLDIDRVSAEALVACEAAVVVNVRPSVSGRYPNLGPNIIVDAGIALIDDVGPDLFNEIREGEQVRVEGNTIYRVGADGDEAISHGILQTPETLGKLMSNAREGLSAQLEAFAANTMEYLKEERDLLLDGVGVPEIRTEFADRHALIVVRGYDYKQDLTALASYIREYRPVLVGVDGGADALLEVGLKPDMIVGDMDSVSDDSLSSGAELVVHAYRDGRAPGLGRLDRMGLSGIPFPAMGTSEDIAMLLADDKGASLIVAVGTHATLVEFLDKGRAGMASTFLTRLRVGSKLVDAKGVSRLYHSRIPPWMLALFVIAGIVAVGAALFSTPTGQAYVDIIGSWWDRFFYWLRGLF